MCATRNTSNREDVFCCNRPEHGYCWLLIAYEITCICIEFMGFPDGAVVKSQPAKCRRHRDVGSVFRSGRSPGVGDGKPTPIFSRKIPRTEEPGGLQSMGSQRVRYNWTHTAHTVCGVNTRQLGKPHIFLEESCYWHQCLYLCYLRTFFKSSKSDNLPPPRPFPFICFLQGEPHPSELNNC